MANYNKKEEKIIKELVENGQVLLDDIKDLKKIAPKLEKDLGKYEIF